MRDADTPALDLGALLLLTLAGAALRLASLGTESLWYDEAATWQLVQGDWQAILDRNATQNSAPPLFPLLLGLVTGPDASESTLRMPALIAGVLAIPLVWLVAREFAPGRYALLAPLLVALSPTQFEYAQEVREYSLAFATACLMLLANARFIAKPHGRTAGAIAAASILGICVQYGNALLAAGAGIACLTAIATMADRARPLRLWVIAQLPVGAAALALFVTTIRPQLEVSVMSPGGYVYLLDRYWDGSWPDLLTLLTAKDADIVHFAYPGKLFLALVLGGLAVAAWRPALRNAAWLAAAPIGMTIGAALAGAYPFGAIRQDLFLLPMLYVCAALGLAAAAGAVERRWGGLAGLGLAGVAVVALAWTGAMRLPALMNHVGNEPMRPLVATLAERLRPGQRIYVYAGAVPAFRYYWRQRAEPWIRGVDHVSGLTPGLGDPQLAAVEGELAGLCARGARFWFVGSHIGADDTDRLNAKLGNCGYVEVAFARLGSYLLRVTPRPASGGAA